MRKFILVIFLLACVSAQSQVPIWPSTPPDAQSAPGPQTEWSNIVRPTMTVYSPARANTGVAIVVFPGGGFEILAMESDILEPVPEVQLLRDHQLIEYGPVRFKNKALEFWLPKSADWYCSLVASPVSVNTPLLKEASVMPF